MKSFFSTVSATLFALVLSACSSHQTGQPQAETTPTSPKIIAYYMVDGSDLQRYNLGQLTHIIYSFLPLNGNQLSFDSAKDKQALQRLVALKKQHLKLADKALYVAKAQGRNCVRASTHGQATLTAVK